MNETWKPVVGWEDLYEISDRGHVRSLDRVIRQRNGRTRRKKGRTLSACLTGNGYPFVGLFRDGVGKQVMVHRLVAEAFLPNPGGKPEVNHMDCDKSNNSASNLEWSTPHENSQHAHDNGRWSCLPRRGEDAPRAALTESDVLAIRAEYVPRRVSYPMLAKKYGVSQVTIRRVVQRLNWTHV